MGIPNRDRLKRLEEEVANVRGEFNTRLDETLASIQEALAAHLEGVRQAESRVEVTKADLEQIQQALKDLQTEVSSLAEQIEVIGLEHREYSTLRSDLSTVMTAHRQTRDHVNELIDWINGFAKAAKARA